ncbi:hypothetical protein PQX77_020356 [Marasmius sp. AFHP31]|nr:hypothetical protein PQX77_020356 [Marasmius sp. AFHP31]
MPALLLSPQDDYDLPTYPPRPLQQRSASISSNDSGVIITPAETSPSRSIIECSASTSPNHGVRPVSLSSERSEPSTSSLNSLTREGDRASCSPTLVNVVPPVPCLPPSPSVPFTVMKSQPLTTPSLFAFPVKDDNTPHASASSPSPLRKFFEVFDNPNSLPSYFIPPSRSAARSVSRGRSSKRPIKWTSPPGSTAESPHRAEALKLEPAFNIPIRESSSCSTSPIPATCSLLMAPERAGTSSPPPPPSPPPPAFSAPSYCDPSPPKFHDLPPITLPPPPSASVIPTLSPHTILSGLGYKKTLPSPPRVSLLDWKQGAGHCALPLALAPPPPPPPVHEAPSKYYFDDGNVVFQVRDTLYKVHRYFFEQNSLTMAVMISSVLERAALMMGRGMGMVNVANFPVVLYDTNPADFEKLLSIFYPADYSQHDAQSVEDWTSILRVSTRFGMSKIRSLALDNVYMMATAVEKIALNNEFKFDDVEIETEWLLDAYVELVTRPESLTFEEGEKIGMRDVIRIQTMKTTLMKEMRRFLDLERVRAMVHTHL